jgi:hypothetical protein
MKRRQLDEVQVKVRASFSTWAIMDVVLIIVFFAFGFGILKNFVLLLFFIFPVYIVFRIRRNQPLWIATLKQSTMMVRDEIQAFFGFGEWSPVPLRNIRILKTEEDKARKSSAYLKIKIEYPVPGQNEKRKIINVGQMDECFPDVVEYFIRELPDVRFSPEVLEAVKPSKVEKLKKEKESARTSGVIIALLTIPVYIWVRSHYNYPIALLSFLLVSIAAVIGWEKFKARNRFNK